MILTYYHSRPEKTVLDDNKRILATYPNLKNGTEVTLKDIGIQLSWTAVSESI